MCNINKTKTVLSDMFSPGILSRIKELSTLQKNDYYVKLYQFPILTQCIDKKNFTLRLSYMYLI